MGPPAQRGALVAAAALIASTLACDSAPLQVDVGALEGAVFLIALDTSGRLTRVDGPMIVAGGEQRGGRRPAQRVGGAGVTLLAVAVPLDALEEAVEGFRRGDADRLRLRAAEGASLPEPHDRGRRELLWRPLANLASFHRIDPESGALTPLDSARTPDLELGVLRDPEHCRPPGWGPLVPYGAMPQAIPPPEPAAPGRRSGLRVLPVDYERALLVWQHIHLIRRGRAFFAQPSQDYSNWIRAGRLVEAEGVPVDVTHVALDPVPLPDGSLRVITSVVAHRGPGRSGWLADLRLDGTFLSPLSSTLLVGPEPFDDLDVGPDGRVLVMQRGHVTIRERDGTLERLHRAPLEPEEGSASRAIWTRNPVLPILAASRSRIHFWVERERSWLTTDFAGPGQILTLFHGLAHFPEESETWLAGSLGEIHRRFRDQAWLKLELSLPPRFEPCAASMRDGRPTNAREWIAMAADGEHLFLLARDCQAVVTVRRSDLCTALIAPEVEEVEVRPRNTGFVHFGLSGAQLLVVSGDGEVWMSERTP